MGQLIRVDSDQDLERFATGAPVDAKDAATAAADIRARGADEHWMVETAGAVAARCSLWWQAVPPLEGERLGVIGHYTAENDAAAEQLLHHVLTRLSDAGCTLAVGPMDGNTWRRYRFITERGTEPPFLLDLEHPDAWLRQFERAGFEVMARYVSSLNPDLGQRHSKEAQWRRRAQEAGVSLRAIDMNDFEGELARIYELSLASFAHNLLYTPLERDAFMRMYLPYARYVRPELVLLAERDGRLVGYVFNVPDLRQAQRGVPVDTVILKTLAVHPDAAGGGIGSFLCAEAQRTAHDAGYQRLIYAFMHENNPSGRISAHYAHVIRRYALYARRVREA